MSPLEAIVLGLVQGLTEFLPVSSSAHLRIVPELLGWGDPGAAYSAIIQLGTVVAVLIYFARDIGKLAQALIAGLAARQPFGTPEARLAWAVILGSIPIGVLGWAFKSRIETTLRSLYVVAGALIVLALVLAWAEKRASHRRALSDLTVQDGVLIGCAQVLALIPGASRSGVTLTAGFGLGFQREAAARYSFLLSIPATTAAGLLELKHVLHSADRPALLPVAIGIGVAFISGMATIALLLRYLRTRTAMIFVWYRLALGALLLVLLSRGVLSPRSGAPTEPAAPAAAAASTAPTAPPVLVRSASRAGQTRTGPEL